MAFGEFNNNKKWRQSRCSVWSCCVIKNIHVNTRNQTGKLQLSHMLLCSARPRNKHFWPVSCAAGLMELFT